MADDLTLIIGTKVISGWQEVRVTRGIERCPSGFDIVLTELYPGQASAAVVTPGDACEVKIGPDLVITGYVDDYLPSISPDGHQVRITGRGKCQDLVDCAAEWPNGQISGSSVLGIAQKLAAPYGIAVNASGDVGPAIPQFNLMLGESPFEIIERTCRYRALLAYELPDGSLLLGPVGTARAASGFAQGENVQAATAHFSAAQRFSEYRVYLQSTDVTGDLGEGGNLQATATDPAVLRHRRHVVIAEAPGGGVDISKRRALWEAARRAGRANAVSLVTNSWRDSAGNLWAPNTLAPLSLPACKIEQATWLIGEVTYLLGEGGTTAELTLMPPDAFRPEPVILPYTFGEHFK